MAPLGPMMDLRVCVRPAWSWAVKSGTVLPTSGPVLIFWPQRFAANKVSHAIRRIWINPASPLCLPALYPTANGWCGERDVRREFPSASFFARFSRLESIATPLERLVRQEIGCEGLVHAVEVDRRFASSPTFSGHLGWLRGRLEQRSRDFILDLEIPDGTLH